ncbi:MAG: hypothetical protein FWC73_06175 [Defluviitaleaceae bacterium]|nr:hypothetical protein [Defluviitaleaceae bacterium]
MKQLTIYTRIYAHLLEEFVHDTYKIDNRSGLFSLTCRVNLTDGRFIEGIISMLTDIAQQENPIYQHSPKLRDMAGDLHNTQVYANLKKELIRFIRHNSNLHLEGYVSFRMTEYREKLDMMSYSLIKKMKLLRQD